MAKRSGRFLALLAMIGALGCYQPGASGAGACPAQPGILVGERAGQVLVVTGGDDEVLPIDPGTVRQAARFRQRFDRLAFPRWLVVHASDERRRRVTVTDRSSGEVMIDSAFPLRIELAVAASSASGRYTVVVQSNNVASEVTVLDAAMGRTRLVPIPHDAPLAAYAIGVAFNPVMPCVAISMARVNGPGAETWLLDLNTGDFSPLPVADFLVRDWARAL